MPEASSNHSHTTLVHSTAYRPAASRSCRARTSTANAGSSHTRWCTHVIGLIRHAVSPVRANAAAQSPTATARRARTAHTLRSTTTTAAHTARSVSPSRARIPCTDWFDT